MPAFKEIDVEAVKTDAAAGMSRRALAAKYGVSRYLIQCRLRGMNGNGHGNAQQHQAGNEHAEQRNGNGRAPAGVDELTALLDEHWARLSVMDKVRFLLEKAG